MRVSHVALSVVFASSLFAACTVPGSDGVEPQQKSGPPKSLSDTVDDSDAALDESDDTSGSDDVALGEPAISNGPFDAAAEVDSGVADVSVPPTPDSGLLIPAKPVGWTALKSAVLTGLRERHELGCKYSTNPCQNRLCTNDECAAAWGTGWTTSYGGDGRCEKQWITDDFMRTVYVAVGDDSAGASWICVGRTAGTSEVCARVDATSGKFSLSPIYSSKPSFEYEFTKDVLFDLAYSGANYASGTIATDTVTLHLSANRPGPGGCGLMGGDRGGFSTYSATFSATAPLTPLTPLDAGADASP